MKNECFICSVNQMVFNLRMDISNDMNGQNTFLKSLVENITNELKSKLESGQNNETLTTEWINLFTVKQNFSEYEFAYQKLGIKGKFGEINTTLIHNLVVNALIKVLDYKLTKCDISYLGQLGCNNKFQLVFRGMFTF